VTALFDQPTRVALLQSAPNLDQPNFVEAVQEDLADGVRREFGPTHPASLPRRAFNNFQWQLPTTLPTTGGPNDFTSEVHSFSLVFPCCFYDPIRFMFDGVPVKDEAALLLTVQTAARLLIAGAKATPASRFYREVGRSMVLADSGANKTAIGKA